MQKAEEKPPTPTSSDDGKTSAKTGNPPDNNAPEAKFTQADLDRVIGERLQEERERQQREADKARRETEQADAIKRGEHEQVISSLKAEKAGLETKLADAATTITALKQAVDAQLDAAVAALPEQVRKLQPKRDDLAAFNAWLKDAQTLAEQLDPKEVKPGNPPNPKPRGETGEEARASVKRSLLRSGRY